MRAHSDDRSQRKISEGKIFNMSREGGVLLFSRKRQRTAVLEETAAWGFGVSAGCSHEEKAIVTKSLVCYCCLLPCMSVNQDLPPSPQRAHV